MKCLHAIFDSTMKRAESVAKDSVVRKEGNCEYQDSKLQTTVSRKPYFQISFVLSFISGIVIARLIPSRSYNSDETLITRGSHTWSGVISIKNHSEICTESMCNEWDAVVVLGGGPEDANGIPIWTKHRLDAVLEIYKCCSSLRSTQLKIITTSAGSAHG